jgi:hypothetical protein
MSVVFLVVNSQCYIHYKFPYKPIVFLPAYTGYFPSFPPSTHLCPMFLTKAKNAARKESKIVENLGKNGSKKSATPSSGCVKGTTTLVQGCREPCGAVGPWPAGGQHCIVGGLESAALPVQSPA